VGSPGGVDTIAPTDTRTDVPPSRSSGGATPVASSSPMGSTTNPTAVSTPGSAAPAPRTSGRGANARAAPSTPIGAAPVDPTPSPGPRDTSPIVIGSVGTMT